jgi:hypothetical protein
MTDFTTLYNLRRAYSTATPTEWMIAASLGEAGGEGPLGTALVADVMRNRAAEPLFQRQYGTGVVDQILGVNGSRPEFDVWMPTVNGQRNGAYVNATNFLDHLDQYRLGDLTWASDRLKGQINNAVQGVNSIGGADGSGPLTGVSGGAQYYLNPDVATNSWAANTYPQGTFTVGGHSFYGPRMQGPSSVLQGVLQNGFPTDAGNIPLNQFSQQNPTDPGETFGPGFGALYGPDDLSGGVSANWWDQPAYGGWGTQSQDYGYGSPYQYIGGQDFSQQNMGVYGGGLADFGQGITPQGMGGASANWWDQPAYGGWGTQSQNYGYGSPSQYIGGQDFSQQNMGVYGGYNPASAWGGSPWYGMQGGNPFEQNAYANWGADNGLSGASADWWNQPAYGGWGTQSQDYGYGSPYQYYGGQDFSQANMGSQGVYGGFGAGMYSPYQYAPPDGEGTGSSQGPYNPAQAGFFNPYDPYGQYSQQNMGVYGGYNPASAWGGYPWYGMQGGNPFEQNAYASWGADNGLSGASADWWNQPAYGGYGTQSQDYGYGSPYQYIGGQDFSQANMGVYGGYNPASAWGGYPWYGMQGGNPFEQNAYASWGADNGLSGASADWWNQPAYGGYGTQSQDYGYGSPYQYIGGQDFSQANMGVYGGYNPASAWGGYPWYGMQGGNPFEQNAYASWGADNGLSGASADWWNQPAYGGYGTQSQDYGYGSPDQYIGGQDFSQQNMGVYGGYNPASAYGGYPWYGMQGGNPFEQNAYASWGADNGLSGASADWWNQPAYGGYGTQSQDYGYGSPDQYVGGQDFSQQNMGVYGGYNPASAYGGYPWYGMQGGGGISDADFSAGQPANGGNPFEQNAYANWGASPSMGVYGSPGMSQFQPGNIYGDYTGGFSGYNTTDSGWGADNIGYSPNVPSTGTSAFNYPYDTSGSANIFSSDQSAYSPSWSSLNLGTVYSSPQPADYGQPAPTTDTSGLWGGYGGGYGALTGGDGAYYEGNADGGAGQFAALAAQNTAQLQAINQQQQADMAAQMAQMQAYQNAQVQAYNSQAAYSGGNYNPQASFSQVGGYVAPANQYQPQFGTGIGAPNAGIGNGYF